MPDKLNSHCKVGDSDARKKYDQHGKFGGVMDVEASRAIAKMIQDGEIKLRMNLSDKKD